ncbi:MAG: hypothetical protein ABI262_07350, partial [Microcoleus sp.]
MKEKLVGLLLVPLVDSVRSVPADNLSVRSQYGSVKKVIALKKVIAITLGEPQFIEKRDSLCNFFSERITMTIALSVRSQYDSVKRVIAQSVPYYVLHLIEKLDSLRNYFPAADRLAMTLSLSIVPIVLKHQRQNTGFTFLSRSNLNGRMRVRATIQKILRSIALLQS